MPDLEHLVAAIALAAIPTLAYLTVLNAIDRYEKEPWTILLACIVLGAVVAPLMSVVILTVLGRPAALLPQFAPGPGSGDPLIGIVQETVNAACLLVLVRLVRDEFDDVLDGVVYGAAIGAGFAATESFIYALGGTSGLDAGSIGSLLVAGLDHAFYVAIFGAVAGFAAGMRDAPVARIVVLYGVATAALLHAFHDTLPAILARLVDQPDAATGLATRAIAQAVNVLGIVTLAVLVWAAWGREGRVVRRRLADELEHGVIGADDYATIGSVRARLGRQYAAFRRQGLAGVRAVRQLYAALGELAFVKERLEVRRRVRPPEGRADELRAEIERLRHQLGEGP
jgi:RsiW-degrading membrane proteinase PrsW (M82 family)